MIRFGKKAIFVLLSSTAFLASGCIFEKPTFSAYLNFSDCTLSINSGKQLSLSRVLYGNDLVPTTIGGSKGNVIVKWDMATGQMTSNKPMSDGYIQTYQWDNSSYPAQFFIPNNISGTARPQVRSAGNTGVWTNWRNIALQDDIAPTATSPPYFKRVELKQFDPDFLEYNRVKVVDNICVLDADYLIPFKMYAWLNNKDDRDNNVRKVNSKDIKKHKKDVFLLMSLINPEIKIETSGSVRMVVSRFLLEIMEDSFQPKDINITRSKEEMVEILRNIYL